jgi:hypothetical protein
MQRPRDGRIYQGVSGPRLGKHFPAARQQTLNNATVRHNNRRAAFSMWSMLRCYKQGTRSFDIQFCTEVCEDRFETEVKD